jgi:hypothetical protein
MAAALSGLAVMGCAHAADKDEARRLANGVGKYKVHLTTEREKVMGTCTYVRAIQPDLDPVHPPTSAEVPDYFRVEAVLMGADTVLVEGRIGEAYICGPGPLNPDGTLQGSAPLPK